MKKIMNICLCLGLLLGLSACQKNVHKEIISSSHYTKEEIYDAFNVVSLYFEKHFEDCTLTDIWYDEDTVSQYEKEWAKHYNVDEAIVILSNFRTGSKASPTLNPNSEYFGFSWILIRNQTGEWEIKTMGYG